MSLSVWNSRSEKRLLNNSEALPRLPLVNGNTEMNMTLAEVDAKPHCPHCRGAMYTRWIAHNKVLLICWLCRHLNEAIIVR